MDFFKLQKKYNCVIVGNVWDMLSTIIMQESGFHALATTSWGVANTFGYNDGEYISFSDYFEVIKKIKSVTKIPLSIDIESGFSCNNKQIINNVLQLAEIGCLGINIEDSNKQKLKNADEHSILIERIRASLDMNGFSNFFINARIDTYITMKDCILETIIRANKYQNAGANGIFIPGLKESSEIKEISQSIKIPLNVMSLPDCYDIDTLIEAGVKRFSFGNAMSDAIISYIETLSNNIHLNRSTKELYNHADITTKFQD